MLCHYSPEVLDSTRVIQLFRGHNTSYGSLRSLGCQHMREDYNILPIISILVLCPRVPGIGRNSTFAYLAITSIVSPEYAPQASLSPFRPCDCPGKSQNPGLDSAAVMGVPGTFSPDRADNTHLLELSREFRFVQ